MAIPKVIGTETEYGISAVASAEFNPVISSSLLISTYAGALRRIRWDYEQESPLRDARGFEPVQLREPSEEDLGLANVILPNGARYYVDHAHPEYSTPECVTPRDLVIHDKAGERVLERSLDEVHRTMPGAQRLAIYKNNSDGKGNSYGTHENYLVDRQVPFASLVAGLTPFFVSRSDLLRGREARRGGVVGRAVARPLPAHAARGLLRGRGRPGDHPEAPDHQHARRAARRPREVPPPARDRRRREPVRGRDAAEARDDLARVLKLIEDGDVPDLTLATPVPSLHDVSRDLTCTALVRLADGRKLTAVQMQWEYLERARKYVEQEDTTADNLEVLERWEAS